MKNNQVAYAAMQAKKNSPASRAGCFLYIFK
jgi:hypothetical protein